MRTGMGCMALFFCAGPNCSCPHPHHQPHRRAAMDEGATGGKAWPAVDGYSITLKESLELRVPSSKKGGYAEAALVPSSASSPRRRIALWLAV